MKESINRSFLCWNRLTMLFKNQPANQQSTFSPNIPVPMSELRWDASFHSRMMPILNALFYSKIQHTLYYSALNMKAHLRIFFSKCN